MQNPANSKRRIDEIFRLITAGLLDQALQQCTDYLADDPEDINLVALHGAVLLKLGNFDQAQHALEKANRLEPDFAKPYEDQAIAY